MKNERIKKLVLKGLTVHQISRKLGHTDNIRVLDGIRTLIGKGELLSFPLNEEDICDTYSGHGGPNTSSKVGGTKVATNRNRNQMFD